MLNVLIRCLSFKLPNEGADWFTTKFGMFPTLTVVVPLYLQLVYAQIAGLVIVISWDWIWNPVNLQSRIELPILELSYFNGTNRQLRRTFQTFHFSQTVDSKICDIKTKWTRIWKIKNFLPKNFMKFYMNEIFWR